MLLLQRYGAYSNQLPKEKKKKADEKAKEIAATTATTITDDASTIGTQPTTINVDPVTGERIFSTFVEVDDDEGEFNMATVLQEIDEPIPDGWEFNLATIATDEKVMAARDEPVLESWILLDSQST